MNFTDTGVGMSSDWYWHFLGLAPGASKADIKRGYHRLAKLLHRDRGGTDEDMRRLNEAYTLAMGEDPPRASEAAPRHEPPRQDSPPRHEPPQSKQWDWETPNGVWSRPWQPPPPPRQDPPRRKHDVLDPDRVFWRFVGTVAAVIALVIIVVSFGSGPPHR
jgi:hypothetical protein